MADNDKHSPKKTKKRTTKTCPNCQVENPVAKKNCYSCGNPFPKKQKNWDKIENKGATNITKKREEMEERGDCLIEDPMYLKYDILQCHHNCDVVYLIYHKHGNGAGVTYYGTRGAGVDFIGNKQGRKASEHGLATINLFKAFMEDYKAKQTATATSKTANPTTTFPPSSITTATTAHPTTTTLHTSTTTVNPTTQSTLVNPTTTTVQPTSMTTAHPTMSSTTVNPTTTAQSISTANPRTLSTTVPEESLPTVNPMSATTVSLTPTMPVDSTAQAIHSPEMVCYKKNGDFVAIGYSQPHIKSLYGHTIPPGFVCTYISKIYTKQPQPAPLVLNTNASFLKKGTVFPLPETDLQRATLQGNDALLLNPYSTSQQ